MQQSALNAFQELSIAQKNQFFHALSYLNMKSGANDCSMWLCIWFFIIVI